MLYPSIDSLLDRVHSKYLLVTVAAKRARNMQDEKNYKLTKYVSHKNVGKSLEEIYAGELQVENSEEASYDEPGVNIEANIGESEL